MTFVIDASVAIKWFIREDLQEQALDLLENARSISAPDLIVIEITNVLWKKVTRNQITEQQALLISSAIQIPLPALRSSLECAGRALELSFMLKHPVYDCIYIACAEMTDSPLVTADRRLLRVVAGTPYAARVRFLGDPGLSGIA